MLQEHWLTPSNLCNFERHFSHYFAFGCSAMASRLESGMLRGRPFGGIMTLISKTLRKQTVTIHCEERFSVVKVFNRLFINVYLPCSGSSDRVEVYKTFGHGGSIIVIVIVFLVETLTLYLTPMMHWH